MNILSSVTKICLLLVVIGAIVMNFMWIEAMETFKTISICIVSFYFWQKAVTNSNKDSWNSI